MLKNIIKTNKFLSITLEDGTVLVSTDVSKQLLDDIMNASSDDEIINLVNGEQEEDDNTEPVVSDTVRKVYSGEVDSEYIEFRGDSAYIPSISELTVPQNFVEEILKAEQEGDETALSAYLNFWTLVSLNPDSRVRENIFWFIKKWNIKITKGGMLVAYRNADFKKVGKYSQEAVERITNDWVKIKGQKKSPKRFAYDVLDDNSMPKEHSRLIKFDDVHPNLDELYEMVTDNETYDTNTYTDHHSGTFTIKIGDVVSMPREQTDGCQEHSCSQGLHLGGPGWLKKGYYGDVGLVCLVNPANIVAVP